MSYEKKKLSTGPGHGLFEERFFCAHCHSDSVCSLDDEHKCITLCPECGEYQVAVKQVGRWEWDGVVQPRINCLEYVNKHWVPKETKKQELSGVIGWQPIDTAPKGVRILVWDGVKIWLGKPEGYWSPAITHWMPLPDGPKGE